MKRLGLALVIAVVAAGVVAAILLTRSPAELAVEGVVLADGIDIPTTASSSQQRVMVSLASADRPDHAVETITVDYPAEGSIFPPEIVAPMFLWHDPADEADRWLIEVSFADTPGRIHVLAPGGPRPPDTIDERCIASTNEVYRLTPYQASAKNWTPAVNVWDTIKALSSNRAATVTIRGFRSDDPDRILSRGHMTLTTSTDPVGAPIFYRDVPLMPDEGERGVIKPLSDDALVLVSWRLKDISQPDSRAILTDMPTCANCHSFSRDGRTGAMDIDGPFGDKGAYGIFDIAQRTVITTDDVVTWNSFKDKPEGHRTIGFLSRISPDGQVAVSTVNEAVYSETFVDHQFLQVFFPTRGILAAYSRATGDIQAIPGADDPEFVHCDPVWHPEGEWIVFARATARDPYPPDFREPTRANDPAETRIQYDLYRIPFNGGEGGAPEPIQGASDNGMSNTFPKVSPDGKWVVWVKCRNGQLMRPDSRLWIAPFEGGEAREMNCNTDRMNSWHSFSPNGRWLVFSSKTNRPYTQMFLTHIDEDGNDSPPILIANATADNRAVNLPEFVNIGYDDLLAIDTPAVDHYRHFTRGNELLQAERLEEAVAEYRKGLAIDPDASRLNINLADTLMTLGRYDEAVGCYEKLLDVPPPSPIIRANLGWALQQLGRTDEAIQRYRESIAIEPYYPNGHYLLAQALVSQSRTDEAAEHYQTVLRLDPNHAPSHNNLGFILSQRGQPAQAIQHFQAAIQIEPDYTMAYYNLAMVLTKQGRLDESIPYYRRVLQDAPDRWDVNTQLGVVLQRLGENEQAGQQFQRALEINPRAPLARVHLAISLTALGRPDQAADQYRLVLDRDPTHALACNSLAWIMATSPDPQLRNGAEAVRLATIASAQFDHASPGHLDTLAAAYAEAGRFEDAVRAAKEAVRLAREGERVFKAEHYAARLALYEQGRPYRAPGR